jgi:hypothetical protein
MDVATVGDTVARVPNVVPKQFGATGMVQANVGQKVLKGNIFKTFFIDQLRFVEATICLNKCY